MAVTNRKVVRDAFKEFKFQMYDEVSPIIQSACENLLLDAVIRNREVGDSKKMSAHQYTGNLINSIVVIFFRRSTGEKYDYYAYDRLNQPIQREMSQLTRRKTARKRPYHFHPDWQHTPESWYLPQVATDRSTGPSDARAFAATWQPQLNTEFEVCVAYTSEYADWVHEHHRTTGILNSIAYTVKMMKGQGFKYVPNSKK